MAETKKIRFENFICFLKRESRFTGYDKSEKWLPWHLGMVPPPLLPLEIFVFS